ncbi:hypothetical protein OCE55_24795 [Bacillus paranthracis]|uniref:hypothetical protein n=1 Tax=Bacillus cereus group TaxID=86661 RepID=UPI00065B959D|nr:MULTISPECIES: hypothetical protein [Bacillus cereus group]KMQ24759.1 hypothetical protein TU69_13300 [Bacillus cereus]MCU5391236.1 hypothetical protein [Bacillus paranthracis]
MKAKKLICLALPIMLLGVGCETGKDYSKSNRGKEVMEELENKNSSYDEELYALGDALKDSEDILNYLVESDDLVLHKDEYRDALYDLESIAIEIAELKPDKGFKELHKEIIKYMEKYREGINIQLKRIDPKDRDFLDGRLKMSTAKIGYLQTIYKMTKKYEEEMK